MGEIFRELMAEAEAKRPSLSEDRIVELYQAWDKRHGSTFEQLMQTCFTEGHAAAQSRINALLEEVEKYKADVREALEYAHDCAQQELTEARDLYGHYPLDGLGRKVKQASEQLEIVERAMHASLAGR